MEKPFINTTQKKLSKTLRVLSKAAYHKMDDYSPVTADQHRGNLYKRLSIMNICQSSKPNNSIFKKSNNLLSLSYNLFLTKDSLNITSQAKFDTKLKWVEFLHKSKRKFRLYFVKNKNKSKLNAAPKYLNLLKLLAHRLQRNQVNISNYSLKHKLLLNSNLRLSMSRTKKQLKTFKDRRVFRKKKFIKRLLRKKIYNNNTTKNTLNILKRLKKKTVSLSIKRKIYQKTNAEFTANILT
jgi:hypothetical protein